MGQFLQVGICYDVCVFKDDINRQKLTFEDIQKSLCEKIDFNLYELSELDDQFKWELKEQCLMEELGKFLEEQFNLFEVYQGEDLEILSELKSLKTYDEIIELAKKKRYENYQNSEIYEYLYCGTWRESVRVIYNQITFFLHGKISMEGYNRFLKYIETLIKNNSKCKISKAVTAFIG
jgi:hypothetical protein